MLISSIHRTENTVESISNTTYPYSSLDVRLAVGRVRMSIDDEYKLLCLGVVRESGGPIKTAGLSVNGINFTNQMSICSDKAMPWEVYLRW
jgi:hypothetical protein